MKKEKTKCKDCKDYYRHSWGHYGENKGYCLQEFAVVVADWTCQADAIRRSRRIESGVKKRIRNRRLKCTAKETVTVKDIGEALK